MFQAEPKIKGDTTTFEKIKEALIDLNIPPEHIAIKTANINELKGKDLLSRDCEVRYIITINALKEGWDCPFAYVLATLANKSSVVDITQILGRVLRLPHVRKNKAEYLNLSYVLTASSQFQATLTQVVKGLNKAGFSDRDYRETDLTALTPDDENHSTKHTTDDLDFDTAKPSDEEPDIEPTRLDADWEKKAIQAVQDELNPDGDLNNDASDELTIIKAQALAQNQIYEEKIQHDDGNGCPMELVADMNAHKMKPNFEFAKSLKFPQFFLRVDTEGGFFESSQYWQKLSRENLLTDFVLGNLDASIDFDDVDSEVFAVDAHDIGQGDSSIEFKAVKKKEKEKLNAIIRSQAEDGQVLSMVSRLFDLIGKSTFYPIDDNDIKAYLRRIVEVMSVEQRADCLDKDYVYIKKIKEKITSLANKHGERTFTQWLTKTKIQIQPSFELSSSISPAENAPAIAKSLYVKEGKVNDLESTVITGISNLENVVWWHRNLDRGKGFVINGFINHYPDFVVYTENKNILVIETKGDDRDNSDSEDKLKLGNAWASQANQISHQTGYRYHYFMVFKANPIDGALTYSEVLKLAKDL